MKLLLALLISTMTCYAVPQSYPKSPDLRLTPGSLCDTPDSYRYVEKVPYCERALNSYAKEVIFINYKRELGYSFNSDRSNFKVDHFIPLCAGGSNKENNLWPQHVSLATITDQIEAMGCEKLAKGKIGQKDLVELVMRAKLNLKDAPKILKYLKSLRSS